MEEDTLRDKYDFTQLGNPVRGKHATHTASTRGKVVAVRLDADVANVFPDARAVNNVLRLLIDISQRVNEPNDSPTS
jgi:hypothetical protein